MSSFAVQSCDVFLDQAPAEDVPPTYESIVSSEDRSRSDAVQSQESTTYATDSVDEAMITVEKVLDRCERNENENSHEGIRLGYPDRTTIEKEPGGKCHIDLGGPVIVADSPQPVAQEARSIFSCWMAETNVRMSWFKLLFKVERPWKLLEHFPVG